MPVIPFRPPKAPFTVQPPPQPTRRAVIVKWLRKTHGWIGLWGAVLGLLFGSTGILLNHRAVMKIPAVEAQESTVRFPCPVRHPAVRRRWQPGSSARCGWSPNPGA